MSKLQLCLLSPKMLFSHLGGGAGVNVETPTLSPKSKNTIFPYWLGGGGGECLCKIRGKCSDFGNILLLHRIAEGITDSLRVEIN